MRNAKIPSGVVQFFEPLSSLRRGLENKLMAFFKMHGYREMVTSLFSYEDSMVEGLFEPLKTQLFKVIDRSTGKTMILRADITMQITQAIIMGEFEMPARVCYADNIYRDVAEHSGKKREFRQIGIELFGLKDMEADREIIDLAIGALKHIGLKDLHLRVADTYIIERLMDKYGIDDAEKRSLIRELAHKKNLDLIKREVSNFNGDFVGELEGLNDASGYFVSPDRYGRISEYASDMLGLCEYVALNHPDVSVFADLFYCEYPVYHHGIAFDLFSEGVHLLVGGRYGNVTRPFGKYIPATGFAINLDELTYFLSKGEEG